MNQEEMLEKIEQLEKANHMLLDKLESFFEYKMDLDDIRDVIGPQIDVQSFCVPTTTDPEEEARQEEELKRIQYEHSLETFMRLGRTESEARALIESF